MTRLLVLSLVVLGLMGAVAAGIAAATVSSAERAAANPPVQPVWTATHMREIFPH
jgi:hypothetical protein